MNTPSQLAEPATLPLPPAPARIGWRRVMARLRSLWSTRFGFEIRRTNAIALPIRFLLLGVVLGGGEGARAGTNASASLLLPTAVVDSTGVFLHQITAEPLNLPSDIVRLCDPPSVGQTLTLTRAQISGLMRTNQSPSVTTNWTGAERVQIVRRVRLLKDAEIREQLTTTLQREVVRNRGQLELRLSRVWTPVTIPDEPYKIHILDLPTAGVTPSFIVRFELMLGEETFGNFQVAASGRIFRDVPVSRGLLRRGQPLQPDDLVFERRDILQLRDIPAEMPWDNPDLEMMENVSPGAPLFVRSVRIRPAISRGKIVDGKVEDGQLTISVRVEAMEDGIVGQTIRVRNQQSKREFKGKVQDAQTIMVVL